MRIERIERRCAAQKLGAWKVNMAPQPVHEWLQVQPPVLVAGSRRPSAARMRKARSYRGRRAERVFLSDLEATPLVASRLPSRSRQRFPNSAIVTINRELARDSNSPSRHRPSAACLCPIELQRAIL
jgi:hypothetical protein